MDGVLHTYQLDGTQILKETWGDCTPIPLYDNEDSVCGILYNNVPHYFIKNLQGDVIDIVDKDAKTVARYSYDAWGVPTIKSDTSGCSLATVNPFRYRGYYYDAEIGMYYLQSRYYNADVGRFVNADEAETIVITNNLFACCNNDLLNQDDDFGMLTWKDIEKALKKIFKSLLNKFLNYLRNLITYDGNRVRISTSLIAAVIEGFLVALGSVAAFLGKKVLFRIIKKILFE